MIMADPKRWLKSRFNRSSKLRLEKLKMNILEPLNKKKEFMQLGGL
ncbi:MAG: hypothetical protein CM1200mP13_00620 [Candidatus Pelagibacterales bacterium]|nr:MAG: hypothetical protein CM1200mP13_00620 [Pelagibacterales bacterium]